MNDYRISFNDGTCNDSVIITERSEMAARKAFIAGHKHVDITNIELHRENVSATKAQEREALAKIQQIVRDMGPVSYIATALDGALEDAENNIEDDAAYSMKGRYETAQEKLRAEIAEHQATRRELEKTMQALRDVESNIQYLSDAAAEARAKTIPVSLWNELYAIAKERRTEAQADMEQAADTMAHFAECPQDIAFGHAVKRYKAQRERKEIAERLMGQLEGIAPDGAEF